METLIKADIFFFIAAVSSVVLAVLIAVGLIYLIRALRDVRNITRRIKEETEAVTKDIDAFRSKIREEGWKLARLSDIANFVQKRRGRKGRKNQESEE